MSVVPLVWLFQLLESIIRYMYMEYFGVGNSWQLARFVVIGKKLSKKHAKAFYGSCPVKKLFQTKKLNKQLWNTLKQLKSNIKWLNSWDIVKIIRFFPRIFVTCSDYPIGTFLHLPQNIVTPNIYCWILVLP